MIKFFLRIIKYSGKYKKRVLAAAIFSFLKGIGIQMPFMLGFLMFNDFYEGIATVEKCLMYGVGLILSIVLNILSTYASDRLQSTAGYRIFAEKRMDLGILLRKLPMGYFTSGNIGKISSVLSSDMIFVEENVMQSIADMMGNACSAFVTVIFMFIINPYIGAVVISIDLLVIIASHFMNKSGIKHSAIRQQQNEDLTQAVITHIEGISVIKSYNILGEKSKELSNSFKTTCKAALKFEYAQVPWMVLNNALYTLGMVSILGLSIYLFMTEAMTLPYLIGCVLFCFNVFLPMKALYGEAARLTVMSSCLDRIEALFSETPLLDNGTMKIPEKTNLSEISFENVTFSYGNEDVIKNVSFDLKEKTMNALVGPSGGGKSTLASLLARLWDIKSGSIKIRGVDIRNVPLADLMNHISMVFQRVYLFQDTVFNNIAMGKPDATYEEVEKAAKKARCYDFIVKLPNGFDTVIGEGGASLSGGEKQRISIARCILKNAPIVILDEATASIDVDNETYIQEAITELCRGKTLLVIAHRLYTIQNAEQIIVVSGGQVKQKGTHEELMKQDGIYSSFARTRNRLA